MTEQPIVYEGRDPTLEEKEIFEWYQSAKKDEDKITKEGMSRLATLAAAILAGSVGLMNQVPLPVWSKAIGMILLLVSLMFAIMGSGTLGIYTTLAVKDLKHARGFIERQRFIAGEIASWSMYAALVAYVVGALAYFCAK